MYGGMANLAVPCGGSFMPLPPSGVQQMPREWLMRQQLSMGSNPMITPASRAYHLEPLSVLPTSQHGNQSPPLQGQPQGLYPGSMKMMLNGMCMPMQHGQMVVPQQPQKMGMPCIGGYGAPGMRGPQSNSGAGYGSGNFGAMASPSNSSNLGGVGGATYGLHGNDAGTGDWNQINGQGMFQCSGEAQMQNAVKEDDGRPLPFPPGHLLAQYPPVYQQQMIFYYRMLRLQYPDLYQQYMDYYETFYEPLYNPRSPTPEVKEYHAPPPRNKICSPLQPVAPPQLQPVHYLPPSMPEPPRKTEDLQRSNSTLGISRQSSMRRQNSMRRAEVNQLKNEGGLKRLPSMRK
ncbi:hypothetical protein ABL78_2818 [Leptomonas seymouri]|uniref:Uncharacterized protein n=1 Tax=Leptomonas seymouri TaxID=5684 RepID=A0A0N1I737_LEPSE|nr:hypothetical protein ABL78_2818 [Leptomonas seymouri]|eukprot:KPI88088.1 hypothetical protein ABL78_2818 [Leptomonas seymouri]